MKLPEFVTRFLFQRIALKSVQTPYWHLRGYMNRYHVVPMENAGTANSNGCGPVNWRKRPFARALQKLGVAIRVHDIVSSDRPRRPGTTVPDFHDHPWNYVTIVLSGGYWEWRPEYPGVSRAVWRGPGSVLFRKATDLHYLQLGHDDDGKEIHAVTLFTTFRYKQKWGFLMPDGSKMPHNEYHAQFENLYQ